MGGKCQIELRIRLFVQFLSCSHIFFHEPFHHEIDSHDFYQTIDRPLIFCGVFLGSGINVVREMHAVKGKSLICKLLSSQLKITK